jgi:outer membrane receptor protein involved in Fe transport
LNRAYYYNLGAAFYGSNTGYLTTFDNRQLDGNPYAVASLSLVYKGSHNTRAEFGGTYNGNNNSYFVPGFLTFNAVFRRDIAKHVSVLLSGRNIFNFQDLANVAKATPYGTGISTVECKYAKSATDPTEYVQSACESYTNGQQQIEPQQFSAALQIHL